MSSRPSPLKSPRMLFEKPSFVAGAAWAIDPEHSSARVTAPTVSAALTAGCDARRMVIGVVLLVVADRRDERSRLVKRSVALRLGDRCCSGVMEIGEVRGESWEL